MVVFIEGSPNTIKLDVNASVDINGFSAVLACCGVLRTIPDITVQNLRIDYTAEEVQATSQTGTYGELIVLDAEGHEYIKFLPLFTRVSEDERYKAIDSQTIYLTIASTKECCRAADSSEEYVTKGELDEAINSVADTIITKQPVTVETPEGGQEQMTVQEAVQQMVDMQAQIDEAEETHLTGHVVDIDGDMQPDDETLYFRPKVLE